MKCLGAKYLTAILGVGCMLAATPSILVRRAQAAQTATAKPATAKPATAQTSTAKPAKPPASGAAVAAKPAPGVKLPAAVEAAFKQSYPNATIKHTSKETENGKTIYEVESVDNGLARDINYAADGTAVAIEEVIASADVPAPVSSAIKARYPKATIAKREKLTTRSVVTYEFELAGANVKSVELTPDGKFVSPK